MVIRSVLNELDYEISVFDILGKGNLFLSSTDELSVNEEFISDVQFCATAEGVACPARSVQHMAEERALY